MPIHFYTLDNSLARCWSPIFTVPILGPNLDAENARSTDLWRVLAMHHAKILQGGIFSTTDLRPFPGNPVFHVQHFAFDVL
jgi:hypothetical protein